MSIIGVLQDWYESICGGSICTGIQIETMDNSGWRVSIDLFDTVYENKNLNSVHIKKSDRNWFECSKENGIFKGCGGIQNLEDILDMFYSWVND